jgi:hypothetical protein
MRKDLIVFVFLTFVSLNTIAQKQKESCTPTVPIVIDAKVEEWQNDWIADSEGKFLYNICNDANDLYIRLKMSDILTQRRVALFGLTVWLDPSGKKKEKIGLKYPFGTSDLSGTPPTVTGMNRNPKRGDVERELLSDIEVLELIGLAKESIISSRLGLMNGIQVLIAATEDGSYMYEAKIPFKAFRLKKSEISVLGVGFETGILKPQKGKTQPAGSGPGAPFYGNMSPYYQQVMLGPSGGNYEMTIPSKIWTSVLLK